METLVQEGARPLLIVGGNLALDFANTVDDPGGPADFDHLGDVERCREWARHRGLLEPSTAGPHAAEERALRELRRLRGVVQAGFTAVAHGRPFPDPEWRELRRAVAHAVARADLAVDGERVVLRWPGDGLGAIGDAVAQAAYDLLTGDHLTRVKVCAGCHWLFLDQSKNGSRRWCSMEDCGTSAKMRRYVARRAARRASSAPPGH